MAKICMVALVLAALVATSFASDAVFGRALQQAANSGAAKYTCEQASRLAGPAITLKTAGATGCDEMLACLTKNAGSLATTQNLALFKRSCTLCAAATKKCTTPAMKAGPVPDACKAGLSIAPVTKCVDSLLPKVGGTKTAAAITTPAKTTTTAKPAAGH